MASFIAPLMKDALSKYFSNFDANNLTLGMMGTVELTDLHLRTDVLDQFNLPFRVLGGCIGSLYLNIGLGGLAKLAVGSTTVIEVTLTDVHILAVPPSAVPYDKEKAEAAELEQKRGELQSLVEKQKAAAEAAAKGEQKEEEEGGGFVANLILGVINNVKVMIKNIHIRYEDDKLKPETPFSFGVVLNSLEAETCNKDWEPTKVGLDATFFKIVELKSYGFYWNSNEKNMISAGKDSSDANVKSIVDEMSAVMTENKMSYILGPLGTKVKATVTMNPEKLPEPFSLPKADVQVELPELTIGLSNDQFSEALLLAESLEVMQRAMPYRKFRPFNTPVKGHAKEWWKFVYDSSLVEARRRRFNSVWDNYKKHRDLVKQYTEVYGKVARETASDDEKAEAQKLEDQLDNLSIMTARRDIDVVVSREKKMIAEKSSWYSTYVLTEDDMKELMEQGLTDEEKKAYAALKEEHAKPVLYPTEKDYTEVRGNVNITQTVLNIVNTAQEKTETVMKLVIDTFTVSGEVHPVKKGLRVDASMKTILITGLEQDGVPKPELLKSVTDEYTEFLTLTFEKNPFDSNLGQRIKFASERSDVIYHAVTVQKLVDTFKWPEHVELSQASAKLSSKMQDLKKNSMDGMEDLVKDTSAIGVDIKVTAPRIILPQNGELSDSASALIINLGTLIVKSVDRAANEVLDLKALEGDQKVSPEVEKLVYNEYQVKLKDFEVLMALEGEKLNLSGDWDKARTGEASPILKKGLISVDLGQAKITTDPRFPKLKVDVKIPLLDIDITQTRMFKLMHLALTFPIPVTGPAKPKMVDVRGDPKANYQAELDKLAQIQTSGEQPKEDKSLAVATDDFDPANAPQLTNMLCHALISGIKIQVSKLVDANVAPLMSLLLGEVNASVHMKVNGTQVEAALKGLTITYGEAQIKGTDGPVHLLDTPAKEGEPLVRVTLFMMSDECPRKPSGSTKQNIDVKINQLDLTLHQEAIGGLLSFVNQVTGELDRIKEEKEAKQAAIEDAKPQEDAGAIQVSGKSPVASKKKEDRNPGDLDIKVHAALGGFSLQLTCEAKRIARIGIETLSVDFQDGWVSQVVNATVSQLEIADMDSSAKYPKFLDTKDIGNGSALTFHMDKYNDKSSRKELDADMDIAFALGGLRIIAAGTFLGNVMNFANNFKQVQKAIADASVKASEKAYEAVKDAIKEPTDASKIGLNISVGAPEIFIPGDPTTNEAVTIVLGEFKMNNAFSTQSSNDASKNAIIDTAAISLTGAWMGRSVISTIGEIQAHSAYLDPIVLKFDLIRNLSSSWYGELSQFKIILTLEELMARLSVEDLLFNISCAVEVLKGMASVKTPTKPFVIQKLEADDGSIQMVGASPPMPQEEKPVPKSRLFALDAKLNRVGVAGYTRKTILDGQSGSVPRDPTTAISEVSLENINLNADVWTNIDLTAKLELGNFIIADKRPEAKIIKDFIQKKVKSGESPMLAVRFTQTLQPNGDKLMDAGLDTTGIELVLNFDFINHIVKVVNEGKEAVPKILDELKKAQKTLSGEADVAPPSADGIQMVGATPEPEPEKPKSAMIISAKVKIDEMNVLVLEDINTLDTNAIELTVAGNFDADVTVGADTLVHGNGGIKLGLATTNFKTRAEKKLAEIIRPAEFKITVDITPAMKLDVGVELPELALRFSAGTIYLFSKIGGSAAKSFGPKDEGPPPENDYSDVWKAKDNSAEDYWFLKPDGSAGTILMAGATEEIGDTRKVEERVKITVASIAVSLEAGAGSMTTPLVLIDGSLGAEVTNFSSDLLAAGNLRISAAYNNTNVGVWEYLLEPIEVPKAYGDPTFRPWELKFSASKPVAVEGSPKPPMKVNLSSEEPMEVTVSKTGMAALKKIGEAFAASATTASISDEEVKSTPYTFQNGVGVPLSIRIDKSSPFVYFKDGVEQYGEINVAPGEKLGLGLNLHITASSANTGAPAERVLGISIPAFQLNENVNVGQSVARFFPINKTSSSGEPQGIVIDIANDGFTMAITARSLVAIVSEVDIPLDIQNGQGAIIGTVEPSGSFSVPLNDVYENPTGLFLKPRGYGLSPVPMSWISLKTTPRMRWVPFSADESGRQEQATFWAIGEQKPALQGNTNYPTPGPQNYAITIRTQVIINNLLPIPLTFSVRTGTQLNIESGKNVKPAVLPSNPNKAYDFDLTLPNFRGQNWTAPVHLSYGDDAIMKLIFYSQDRRQTICLGYSTDGKPNDPALPAGKMIEATTIYVFCPYWMVNYTGLDLSYKSGERDAQNIVQHPAGDPGPVLLYPEKALSQPSQIGYGGAWSEMIPFDTNTGVPTVISLKVQRKVYELNVSCALSQCALTRIVTISSKYNLVNSTRHPLVVTEIDLDPSTAVTIPPLQSIPYWPMGQVLKFYVKVEGTSEYTTPIAFNQTNNATLRLNNKYGALRANVTKGTTSTSITFSDYNPVEVPLLVVNDTQSAQITLLQHGEPQSNKKTIGAGQSLLYAWGNLKSPQTLQWSAGSSGMMILDFEADAEGDLQFDPTTKYKWISFTKYLQRVLLLTENIPLVSAVKKLHGGTEETQNVDVTVSLNQVGISLLNNVTGKDFLYIRIGDFDPTWEYSVPGQRLYKMLLPDENDLVESAYQKYLRGELQSPVQLRQDIGVDFGKNIIQRPTGPADLIRRKERPALLVGVQVFPTKLSVDLQVNNIQIDNQIAGAKQPILFNIAPIAHKKDTPTEVHPPLLTLTFSKVSSPDGILDMFSGSLILQEFDLRADMAVANAGMDFVKADEGTKAKQLYAAYTYDYSVGSKKKEEFYAAQFAKSASDKKITIFEKISISNLKFNLTFSLTGGDAGMFGSVFMGLGAALVDLTDKPFNIDGLHIKHLRQTTPEFMDTVYQHYKSSIISAVMSIVFGLDVLGNPAKLLGGIGDGLSTMLMDPLHAGEGVGQILGSVGDSVAGITGSLGKAFDGLGLGFLGSGDGGLFGELSSSFKKTSKAAAGKKDDIIEKVRQPRGLFPNAPLKPYSEMAALGQSLKAQLDPKNLGGPYVDFVMVGPNLAFVIAARKVYFAELLRPNLRSVKAKIFESSLEKVNGVRLDRNVFIIDEAQQKAAQSFGLFGATQAAPKSAVVPIQINDPGMAQYLVDKVQRTLQEVRSHPVVAQAPPPAQKPPPQRQQASEPQGLFGLFSSTPPPAPAPQPHPPQPFQYSQPDPYDSQGHQQQQQQISGYQQPAIFQQPHQQQQYQPNVPQPQQPGQPMYRPGQPFIQPGQQFIQPGQQFIQPGQQFIQPGQQYIQPGQQYLQPGQQYVQPGQRFVQPGQPYVQPGIFQPQQPQMYGPQPQQLFGQPGMIRPGFPPRFQPPRFF